MNKLAKLFGAVALSFALIASPAAAAPKKGAKAQQKVKTIFDYKDELGITDDQVKKLKDNVVELQKELQSFREKIVEANKELGPKLQEEASLDAIRPLLQKIANYQVDMRLADISAARKINGTLKPEQLKKWRDVQKKVRTATADAAKAAAAASEEE